MELLIFFEGMKRATSAGLLLASTAELGRTRIAAWSYVTLRRDDKTSTDTCVGSSCT